jgi:hypothetical protein
VRKSVLTEAIAAASELALFQIEEVFCDLFAYGVFGESFLKSYSYILAPANKVVQTRYPTHKERIDIINLIARKEGTVLLDAESLQLPAQETRGNDREKFLRASARSVLDKIIDDVWAVTLEVFTKSKVDRTNGVRAAQHLKEFKFSIPAYQPKCIGDILNAAWTMYEEICNSNENNENKNTRIDTLNEIVFKSLEIYEFDRRTAP